jgi:hypothetical protein
MTKQSPAAIRVTCLSATVQVVGVPVRKLTGSPEVAVADKAVGPFNNVLPPGYLKLMA